jgi:heat shock protein HslJ
VQYDPARLQPGHRYAVRATIRVADALWYTTTQMYPVLADPGNTDAGTLRVERVHAQPVRVDRPLVNTYWRLLTLDGQAVHFHGPGREPHLLLHVDAARATGSGGCNTYTGTYRADAGKLSITSVASTMMACVEGMEVESGFHAALAATKGYRISGDSLTLTGASGKVLATLQAVDF